MKPINPALFFGPNGGPTQRTAVLNSSANFAVLAGASITNTGASVIVGDVGAVSSITPGSPPWTVTGTVHTVNDAATNQALTDAHAVYNTMSVLPSTVLTGDLGGRTLTPGVYSYPSSAGLTGTLTLDFQNLSNQQIIIITGSTLTTASASVVKIVNSNDTNQVFWIVGSSATLGTTTSFAGNIIAQISISFTTGANIVNGNAVALTGSVTMQDDIVGITSADTPNETGPKLQCTAILNTGVGVELCYITKQVTQNRYNLTSVSTPSRTLKRCVLVEGTPVNLGDMHVTVTPFITGSSPSAPTATMHTASNFAVLAGASITNTGSSVITGDVGAVSSITPGPWTVNGTVHTVDDAATQQALVDAQNAYNTLSVLPATTLTGDLAGQTLVSNGVTNGVYKYSSSGGLTGTVTLDFQNLSNQKIVVIFGSTLTTASASVVNVVNTNSTNSIFWVVGSSATLGTTTSFVGNIIAQASISFTTGANLANGSAIGLSGSVTLQDDAINIVPSTTIPMSPLSARKIMSHRVDTFEDDGAYEWQIGVAASAAGEATVESA